MQSIASFDPDFTIVAGDLSYASDDGTYKGVGIPQAYTPSAWDNYFGLLGPSAAESIPWMVGMGNHEQLEKYRDARSGVDFIVVFFHHCPYCSGGPCSDGGDRYVWQPIFDRFDVDVVINGHNHLYERVYPMRNNVVQAAVPPGGTIDPARQGTTYICTGGGGAGLAASATSGWYGTSGDGDLAATGTGTPKIEVWGSETSRGIGSGGTSSEPDPATGWSAYRRAQYCHLVIDVIAPRFHGGQTSMLIRAIDPTQSGSAITSITDEAVMDNVTLVRQSVTGPTR